MDQLGLNFSSSAAVGGQRSAVAELPLSPEEILLVGILEAHRGRAAAIRSEDLALRTGIESKRIREIIHELIVRHGVPIGSTPGTPPGFFLIETAEEAEEAIRGLMSRAMSILVRMSRLKRCSIDSILGQLKLEFENAPR